MLLVFEILKCIADRLGRKSVRGAGQPWIESKQGTEQNVWWVALKIGAEIADKSPGKGISTETKSMNTKEGAPSQLNGLSMNKLAS